MPVRPSARNLRPIPASAISSRTEPASTSGASAWYSTSRKPASARSPAENSRNWRAHAALGRIKEQSGDLPQALQNYQMAYSINRFQPELSQRIATLQTRVSPTQPAANPIANPIAGSGTRNASGPAPFRRY